MTQSKSLSLIEAISMAVGTMIGASIFSIFGVGAQIAGQNLPLAFVLSGIFALLVAYSYATLGSKIVSNAGPIAFIYRGIGDNVITGALGILMWMSYVVSIAMFAKGFAGYFLPLIHVTSSPWTVGAVEAGVIAIFTALNFFGSKAVGRAEFYIVVGKLTVLGIFIVAGFMTIQVGRCIPSFDIPHLRGTLNAAIIFFLSYMGFGLVTNASENMKDPEKNVPRAIYASIGIVMFIYVSVALVAIGNLSLDELIQAKDNALAIAAKPFLGSLGFVLLSVGALFSISSALNATLYGGANIAYSLAKEGTLPKIFERKVWFGSVEGLYLTAGLSLLFVILFNIGAIASIISTIYTVIYIFVLYSHYRIAPQYGGNRTLVLFNTGVLLLVFLALLLYQWQTQRGAFYGSLVTLAGSVAVEYVYRHAAKRVYHLPH